MLGQWLEWLESGERTADELLETCLRRIREVEPSLRAWVEVCPQASPGQGPLHGIPFGVKDIFETKDLLTEFGSPIYSGRKGQRDAGLVRDLRSRGAVMLGKTQTTAFAYFDPAPTRNPHDPRRTPGGSSSGSAAAVAAGMVPFALGTQTQGSVLRPASFCGVTGFKPTHGLLPLEGVLPFAPTLDTAGLFTQTAGDMQTLWQRMGFAAGQWETSRLGAPELLPDVEPAMERAFRSTVDRLRAAGFAVETVELPADFRQLLPAVRIINDYEGARTHEARWREHGDRIGRKLAQLVESGLGIPAGQYEAALETLRRTREAMSRLFQEVPVILTPAAPGPAPLGLESTGDPRMNAPWTGLGTPAVSIPMPAAAGPPLGLQLTADSGHESMLLDTAVRVQRSSA